MKLTFDGVLDSEAVQNRKTFFQNLGMSIEHMVSAVLTHGTQIVTVTEEDRGRIILATDGLTTNQADVILTVTVADCVPIYFFDPKNKAIGLAHAGWRGTLQNIASRWSIR